MKNSRPFIAAVAAVSLISSTSMAFPAAPSRVDFDQSSALASSDSDRAQVWLTHNPGGRDHWGDGARQDFRGGNERRDGSERRGNDGRWNDGRGSERREIDRHGFGEYHRFHSEGRYWRYAPWGVAASAFGLAVGFGVWEYWRAENYAACFNYYSSVYSGCNAACQDASYCSPQTGCDVGVCLQTCAVDLQAHAWYNCGVWVNVNVPPAWTVSPPPPPADMPGPLPAQPPTGTPQYNVTIQPGQ